jgi:hypothetical protein
MRIAPAAALVLMLPLPAAAELPMSHQLDARSSAGLERLLRQSGYPDVSWSSIRIALIGALAVFPETRRVAYRVHHGHLPQVEARSMRSGRCQGVVLTAWFANRSHPPLRLRGRYCERANWMWTATSQQISLLAGNGPLPTLPAPGPGVAEMGE